MTARADVWKDSADRVTDRSGTALPTRVQREQLASMVVSSPNMVVIGDPDGRLVWMNDAGMRLLGLDQGEDAGLYRMDQFFSEGEMARIRAEDLPSLARGRHWEGRWTLQTRDGTQIPVLVSAQIHRDRGKGTYVSAIVLDRRPEQAAQRRRKDGEQRLAAAEAVAGLGSWEWDVETGTVMWSPGMYRLHRMELGSGEESFEAVLQTVHPDDRARVREKAEEAAIRGAGLDFIYRGLRADGELMVVHCRGEMIANESGAGTGASMLGTLLDITEQHNASVALRASEELARSVIATAGEAYIQFDAQGLISEWNEQAEVAFGLAREEALERPVSSLIRSAEGRALFERSVGVWGEASDGLSPGGRFELSMLHRSGREFPSEVTAWSIDAGDSRIFCCLVRDVTERYALERTKNEFISVVGHELRTPLTSIHGALGLLRAGLLGELNDRGQHMVDIAVHNTDRLVRLINDILDMERLNSGKAMLELDECNVAELARQSVEAMRPMADAAGVRLKIDAQPGYLLADPDRIEQTLTNLLSNAIKFSRPGATVWVDARMDGDEVEVAVRDEGRGIPPEHLEVIFDRFHQVDGSDAREKGGTGLGLAICRTIVEQHGGRIWAESGTGRGTTLTFRLPLAPLWGDPGPSGGSTILIGGTASVRDTVADILEPHGYAAVQVQQGDRLKEAALMHRPDVILLDLRMPVMDGWRAVAELRDRVETADIPVVILSLHDDDTVMGWPNVTGGPESPIDADALIAAVERASSSVSAGPSLLLVEDDEYLAEVLTERFRHLGIDAHHVPTAQRALEMCAFIRPDLLVLDLVLPDQDGYAVVKQLRRDERFRRIPLAVYTASDLSEPDRKRLRLGPTVFLTKGRVTPDELEQRVLGMLGHPSSIEERF